MVNRIIESPLEVPVCEDDLRTNRNFMVGLGKLTEALVGRQTVIQGLLCTPTSPASLQVVVDPGQIFSWENVDDSPYSELPQDTDHQIIKQGIELDDTLHDCPAPVTVGFSINYLIQVRFEEVDNLNEERAFYNSADPSQPFYQFVDSQREAKCILAVKAGVAATTGTQITPTPDPEYVGAWVVTVAEGQTEIQTTDITEYPDAPFIKSVRTIYSASVTNDGNDNYTGVTVPPIAIYEDNMMVIVKVDAVNEGDSTLDLGPGAKQILDMDNRILQHGELVSNFPYIMIFSASLDKFIVQAKSATGGAETGDTKFSYRKATEEPEWIQMNDGAIGPTGATGPWTEARYDDDAKDLYFLLWANCDDTTAPVDGTRGASASADWTAAKTMRLPLAAGRSPIGFGSGSGLTPRTILGETGGEEAHQLTIPESAAHTHSHNRIDPGSGAFSFEASGAGAKYLLGQTTGSSGGDTPHNTMHPFTVEYKYIKK